MVMIVIGSDQNVAREGKGGEGRGGGGSSRRVQTYVSVRFNESEKLSVTSCFGPRVYARKGGGGLFFDCFIT